MADIVIKLPQADQLLMPMVAAVPLQLIAYYTAVLKGKMLISQETLQNLLLLNN